MGLMTASLDYHQKNIPLYASSILGTRDKWLLLRKNIPTKGREARMPPEYSSSCYELLEVQLRSNPNIDGFTLGGEKVVSFHAWKTQL